MKVKFIGSGPDDETKVCTMFERDFFRGIEIDVSDCEPHAKKKLAINSHFEVTVPDAGEEQRRKPGRPRKDEGDTVNGELQ